MRNWLAVVVVMAAVAGCGGGDDADAPASTNGATGASSVSAQPDSTVATTDAPTTSAAPVVGPLPVFEEIHDAAGSLWRVEVLGVVEGITSPRVAPRSRTLPPCLAIILHATFLGPESLGSAENLSFGSVEGGSRQWACIPEGFEDSGPEVVVTGTSVITVIGMIDFEEPLPSVVELFARDRVEDTTEYFTAVVESMPDLPAFVAGPTPSDLGDATTPLIHDVADGTVTATVVGAWVGGSAQGLTCVQVAATFVVSEEVHAITVAAQDAPQLVAGGMVQPMSECGAGADSYSIDPNLLTYLPGTVYGMTWSYLVPEGSEVQALVLPGEYTDLIAVTLLDGPPPPP